VIQWHYPFENKEKVESGERKADFIAEGVDQTRGWFYTLHAIGTMIFDDVAYKNVVSNGLVLDKNGQKMSKRLGNAADPFETLKAYGPDATRWYMISNANPWDNLKFDIDGIAEVRRKFFGTLYNTYSFFTLYANIDNFSYAEEDIALTDRPEIDRWILSELHTLIKNVDQYYNEYEPTKAARAISDFVQENLSNWFVRLSRRRYWKGDYQQDKISAYQTTFVNKALEHKMQKAQSVCSLVLSLRQKEKIKVRQPLQRIMIPVLNEVDKAEINDIAGLIKSEVNVKEIELLDDASGILVKQIKPNFKNLGPRFGKDMKLIANKIQSFDQETIKILEQTGSFDIEINDKIITLGTDDVEISSQDIEGWLVANSGSLTVALDITITPELKKEGIARELVNRIQNIRKDSGLEVTDRIGIVIQENKSIHEAVATNEAYIKNETLTETIEFSTDVINGTEIAFDDIVTQLLIKKQ